MTTFLHLAAAFLDHYHDKTQRKSFFGMQRRGVTILELTIAIILIGVLLTGIGRMLSVMAAQQRESQRRIAALQEAANQMERLAVRPWEQLTAEHFAVLQLSAEAAETLPSGTLVVRAIDVEPQGDAPAARRLEVEIRWRNLAGKGIEPVRLTAWRFAGEEAP